MLAFADFENILNRVKKFWDRLTEINTVTDGCVNAWEMTNGGCIDDVLYLLQQMLGDTEEWLSYWVYDLEWGTEYKPGCVKEADGSNIKLETMRELYDFLYCRIF